MEAAKGSSAVTGEDIKALQCGVCNLPLKPPIFQCIHGRVAVCLSCYDKVTSTGDGECGVCGVSIGSDYRIIRYHAMERLVASSGRVPCTHAAHGCAAKLAPYYDLYVHRERCPYAPYSCPAKACGFVGNLLALLEHLSGVHSRVEAVQQFWEQDLSNAMAKLRMNVAAEEENEAGMPTPDIELVMNQAKVSRSTAVKALKENGGDIVCALLGLMD